MRWFLQRLLFYGRSSSSTGGGPGAGITAKTMQWPDTEPMEWPDGTRMDWPN